MSLKNLQSKQYLCTLLHAKSKAKEWPAMMIAISLNWPTRKTGWSFPMTTFGICKTKIQSGNGSSNSVCSCTPLSMTCKRFTSLQVSYTFLWVKMETSGLYLIKDLVLFIVCSARKRGSEKAICFSHFRPSSNSLALLFLCCSGCFCQAKLYKIWERFKGSQTVHAE